MTIQGTKKVLVTGIGGYLEGAIVPRLLSEGHSIRVHTGMPELFKGMVKVNVEVVQGNIGGREEALKALDGMNGACLVGGSYEGEPWKEVEHGKTLIDACLAKGIGHVVYVSVCCSDKNTGVPHFEAKHEVEEYLKKSGLSYTVLRPAWYMENFLSKPYIFSIGKSVLSMPLRPDRTLELVSDSDVGRIVAEAFTVPDKLTEREIDLAADRMTMEEIAEEISRVMPKKVVYKQISVADAGREMSGDVAIMFKWMEEHGFNGDLLLAKNLLQRFEIPLTSFRSYLDSFGESYRKAA